MKTTIKIVSGKRGWHLKVNDLFISHGFTPEPIKAIRSEYGIPYGATEWISIQAIKDFWHKYMPLIIASTNHPYRSVWGNLFFISESIPEMQR
jgi:hypothetical protein